MNSRVDEEKAAVNPSVGDVAVAHSGKLLPQVSAVLILYVLDDRVPAVVQQHRN